MDGLMAVSPLAEEERLRRLRPRLAMGASSRRGEGGLLDLDARFGLHPALAPLQPLFADGRLAVVHAVGSPDPTRSHFDAQDYLESGTPGRKGTRTGWLNRASGLLGHDASPLRSMALTPSLPRSLYGPEPALAVADLAKLRLGPGGGGGRNGELEALYRRQDQDPLARTGSDAFEALALLEEARLQSVRGSRGVRYPRSPLGGSLSQVASLIRGNVGLEIAFVESNGWDTHVQQGTTQGSFARQARDLASSIAAFWEDLGTHRDDVLLLTMTEFGRTVRENGSGGTDHGHGSCLFVLGQEVAGGEVLGTFPGLHPGDLYEGRDLPVTTDFRAVFSEVATGHLGVRDSGSLFPGWRGERLPILRRRKAGGST
jgi:uncharacterized protein (DUF1501 family)